MFGEGGVEGAHGDCVLEIAMPVYIYGSMPTYFCTFTDGSKKGKNPLVCPMVSVFGASYADCDGQYAVMPNVSVEWAPDRPGNPNSID